MSAMTSLTMLLTSRWCNRHAGCMARGRGRRSGVPSVLRVSLVVAMSGSGKCPDGLYDFSLYSMPLPSSVFITSGTCNDSGEFDSSPNLQAPSRSCNLCGAVYRSGEVLTPESLYTIRRRTIGETTVKNEKYISFHSPLSHDREDQCLSVTDECRQALSSTRSASRL